MPQMTVTQARDLVGWSQSELARRATTSVSNIRDLENGVNPNPSWQLVARIVLALRKGGLRKLQPFDVFPVQDRKAA